MVDLPSVGESHVTGLGTSDDTGLGDQRVGQGRLSVVDVSDDRHVSERGIEMVSTVLCYDGDKCVRVEGRLLTGSEHDVIINKTQNKRNAKEREETSVITPLSPPNQLDLSSSFSY